MTLRPIMTTLALTGVLAGAMAIPCFAEKDFLTSSEVEKVREAQEPNARLKLYVLFARQRIDQLQKLLAKEKQGRSLSVRELLLEYAGIVDAMDAVADDALKRHVNIEIGRIEVRDAERKFLALLEKIESGAPADLDRYDIELKEAIAATSDSLELALSHPNERAVELETQDEQARREREAILAAEDALTKKGGSGEDSAATGAQPGTAGKAEEAKPARKPPTLLRQGETTGDSAGPR